MKKTKILTTMGIAVAAVCTLASCKKTVFNGYVEAKNSYTVGVLQYAEHPALDKATQGFKDVITEKAAAAGKTVTFKVQNPEGKASDTTTMAKTLVRDCDLVLGNATPAAVALKNATRKENKNIPVLFTSVTDPVAAKLLKDNNAPDSNVTGTSDANPVKEQIDLVKDLDSSINKIGFLYTASEVNSKVQCDSAEAYAKTLGMTTYTQTINDVTGISAAVNALDAKGVKVIYIPTDNLLAKSMGQVKNATHSKSILTVCGEESMVTSGGSITISVNYENLGRTTGEMAAKILFEQKYVKDLPVQSQTSGFNFTYNADEMMGYTFSETFISKYNVQ